MVSSLTAVPTVAVRWLLGLNLEQSRFRNAAAYVAIMLVATGLGADAVVAWLAVLAVRTVGRLTLFRMERRPGLGGTGLSVGTRRSSPSTARRATGWPSSR